MRKGFLISVVFLVLACVPASAEIYRCELTDGEVLYSDKPINLSDDCKLVEENSTKTFRPYPSTSRKKPPRQPVVTKESPVRHKSTAEARFRESADSLVAEYNATVKTRFRASNIFDKQKAIRELKRIKEDKAELLNELAESKLEQRQQEEILETLKDIAP